MITNPIYAFLCKDFNTTKKVLGIVAVLEGAMIFTISFLSNFTVITILTVLAAIFGSCHFGLLDSLTVLYAKEKKEDYASIRLFGSVGYVVDY